VQFLQRQQCKGEKYDLPYNTLLDAIDDSNFWLAGAYLSSYGINRHRQSQF
jgi:hypothetical protein